MEEQKALTKKSVIKNSLVLFFGTIIFIAIIMLVFAGTIFWKYLLIIAGGFFVFVTIIAFIMYKAANKSPKTMQKIGSPKSKKYIGIFVILFGVFLIIQGCYVYFSGLTEPTQIKAILIKLGFGAITIIWGIYQLRKNKLNNYSKQTVSPNVINYS